jgi:hypothetical protein
MESRITTDKIEDLLEIFNPELTEQDDVGDGARILYTVQDSQPSRQRVGESFILHIQDVDKDLFVFIPTDGDIEEGTITLPQPVDGVPSQYSTALSDVEQLVSTLQTLYEDDNMVNDLLDK